MQHPAALPLTPREAEILRLVFAGLDNERVAHVLGCSPSTVKIHLRAVKERLGLEDEGRRWVVRAAYALGRAEGAAGREG